MKSNMRTREAQVPEQICLTPEDKEVTTFGDRILIALQLFYQTLVNELLMRGNVNDILDCGSCKEGLTRWLELLLKSALYNILVKEREDSVSATGNDIHRQCEESCDRFFRYLEENGMALLCDFCRWVKGDFSKNLVDVIDRRMAESIHSVMVRLYNLDIDALVDSCIEAKENERAYFMEECFEEKCFKEEYSGEEYAGDKKDSVLQALQEAKDRGKAENEGNEDRHENGRWDDQ